MQVNDKCESMWQMYFKYTMGGFVVNNIIMSAVSILFNWQKYGRFDGEHAFRAYKVVYVYFI